LNTGNLKNILKDVKSGKTTIDKAIKELKFLSFENLHFAREILILLLLYQS